MITLHYTVYTTPSQHSYNLGQHHEKQLALQQNISETGNEGLSTKKITFNHPPNLKSLLY